MGEDYSADCCSDLTHVCTHAHTCTYTHATHTDVCFVLYTVPANCSVPFVQDAGVCHKIELQLDITNSHNHHRRQNRGGQGGQLFQRGG